MDELSEQFHSFLQELSLQSKRGTSGMFCKEFEEKVKDTIENPSTAGQGHEPKTLPGCVQL
jgi:hypothetical protein